jgi:predicted glycogen debranching enzyme
MCPDADSPRRGASPLSIGRDACRDYAQSSHLEWLEANGTGGFAMGTVAGSNTRRYHGLLVASLHPPVERVVTLARLEETVVDAAGDAPLSTNQYPGALYPKGFQRLLSFELNPCPTWTFEVGEAHIEKRLFLVRGGQTVVVLYRATRAVRLKLEPLLCFRDYHGLVREADGVDTRLQEELRGDVRRLTFHPRPALPPLFLHHPGEAFSAAPSWHDNVEYLVELDRGLEFREDLFLPGSFRMDVGPKKPGWVVATLDAQAHLDWPAVQTLESARDARARPARDAVDALLLRAADQFLVRRMDGSPTLLAGYPWFTDWGRDTMIALPGLLLTTGHLAEAQHVLEGFLAHLKGGLVPNHFPDQFGPAEYNTADATLWMFQTVQAFLLAGGARAFLADVFYPAARSIVEAHLHGTLNGIGVDDTDGLLVAGGPGSNLTWMDARVDGQGVTPRHGKPVEVNALYYNALRLMEHWAGVLQDGPSKGRYRALADRTAAAFDSAFWNPEKNCLYDVLLPEGPDGRLRPNQLLALSLSFPLLNVKRRVSVLERVEAELLTPVGLRTLAPSEPGYRPWYRGGPAERDAAYHQGLVWPWLLGPFIDACLSLRGNTEATRLKCLGLLQRLEAHLVEAGCLGSISECFEAEAPFRPVGAPAQAWSVGEVFRVRARLLGAR